MTWKMDRDTRTWRLGEVNRDTGRGTLGHGKWDTERLEGR